jgi:hypothetical protein
MKKNRRKKNDQEHKKKKIKNKKPFQQPTTLAFSTFNGLTHYTVH